MHRSVLDAPAARLAVPVLPLLLGLALLAAAPSGAQPAPAGPDIDTLTQLSLQELLELDVTSVSRRPEAFSEAAAALFVVTNEDIRRSGARSIPEALRMVPGLQVARVSGNRWAITARGFNSLFATKLLVLIDGRTVYSPLFSGVYWDVQDLMLEDVDRIEVIRGPGGTLWGANAVNGVINVVTRRAEETQGVLVTGGGGSHDGFAAARYGGSLGERTHFRGYAKWDDRDAFEDRDGYRAEDASQAYRGGFRIDGELGDRDDWTLQGDVYEGIHDGNFAIVTPSPPFAANVGDRANVDGWNLLARWSRRFSESSDLTLQAYYDRTTRKDELAHQDHDTYDVDFQHRFAAGDDLELIWGLGYRRVVDEINGTFTARSLRGIQNRRDDLFSGFGQGRLELFDDRLRLIAGTKVENNDYSGWEVQPTARFAWLASERSTLWGAVSRAIREPSRANDDILINFFGGAGPSLVRITGNRRFAAENLLAYELGYRTQPRDDLFFDLSLYYNRYDDLITNEFVANSFEAPFGVANLRFDNRMDGEGYGAEVATRWQVNDAWRLSLAYSYTELNLSLDSDSVDFTDSASQERNVPSHQVHLRSQLDLPYDLQLDGSLHWVENVPGKDVNGYARVDLRLGWQPRPGLAIDLVGQNLFENEHDEWGSDFLHLPTSIPRTFYAKLTWRFGGPAAH